MITSSLSGTRSALPSFRQPPLSEVIPQVQYIWQKLRGPRKLFLVNYFGPHAHTSPKVVWLFLLVSINWIFRLSQLMSHRQEPLSNSLGFHRKSIRFAFPTTGSVHLSHPPAAYLSDWNPEVSTIHTSLFIPLTMPIDVRTKLIPRKEHHSRRPPRCARFVRYEGSMTVTGINVVGLMMLLRYAPNLSVSQPPC